MNDDDFDHLFSMPEGCEYDIPDVPDDIYCSCFCPMVIDSYTFVTKFKFCTECKKEYKEGKV